MYMEIGNPADYRAALYIRLSKEDDSESESQSVTNQRSLLRDFSLKQGLSVYDEYIDDGFSGGNYDRPAFDRLIADIEAGRVNMVVTKDLSRLGRDYIQTGHYLERYFPEKRVRYISLLDGIDTDADSSANDITPFRAIINDMYAKDISKKIKSVKRDKQRKGLFIGGKAPYGYKLSPDRKNTLVIDEEAADVVRMIFAFALSGKSCREIASELNGQNIPPPAVYANIPARAKGPYSGMWSSERVVYTLKNQMYVGDMVQGTRRRVNYKSKKCVQTPKEQWVIVEDTHPAIIEKAVFEKVQLLINSRKRTRTRKYDYILKGMVFCKECGYPLGVVNRILSGGKPTLYFLCRTYQRFTKSGVCTCHCIRVEAVTRAVLEKIDELCLRHIDLRELNDIAQKEIVAAKASHKNEADIQKLSAKIGKVEANMDKLYSDKLNGVLENMDFQRFYERLKSERAVLRDKLEAAQRNAIERAEPTPCLEKLIEEFIEAADENRELICGLVKKIELTKDKEIYIHFRFRELSGV